MIKSLFPPEAAIFLLKDIYWKDRIEDWYLKDLKFYQPRCISVNESLINRNLYFHTFRIILQYSRVEGATVPLPKNYTNAY
jgi:hypothetical protein